MATADDFYDTVMPYCHGTPITTLEMGVRSAVEYFCSETYILQEDLDEIPLLEDQTRYDLDTGDENLRVAQVRKVRIKNSGSELPAITRRDLDVMSRWEKDKAKEPRFYFGDYNNVIIVYPIPNDQVDDSLIVRVAMTPTANAVEYPDILIDNYKQTISDGAVHYIKRIPGTPSYDPALSEEMRRNFIRGITAAKVGSFKGFSDMRLTARPRRFGR